MNNGQWIRIHIEKRLCFLTELPTLENQNFSCLDWRRMYASALSLLGKASNFNCLPGCTSKRNIRVKMSTKKTPIENLGAWDLTPGPCTSNSLTWSTCVGRKPRCYIYVIYVFSECRWYVLTNTSWNMTPFWNQWHIFECLWGVFKNTSWNMTLFWQQWHIFECLWGVFKSTSWNMIPFWNQWHIFECLWGVFKNTSWNMAVFWQQWHIFGCVQKHFLKFATVLKSMTYLWMSLGCKNTSLNMTP